MTDFIQVHWTAANEEEAKRIAMLLINEKLIACATLIPHVESIYSWQGEIKRHEETKVILKTKKGLFDPVAKRISELGEYEVPEIVEISIVAGLPAYLEWIEENTR